MYYHSSEKSQDTSYILKSIFMILLCFYSLQFFTLDVNQDVMENFLHGVNLIFHEAGHVVFSPFGDFITILGGSLGQILMPLIVGLTFFFKEKNMFWSAFALWWMWQNFTDVALYISDANARSLPLIWGMSEDAHDWGNILTMTNMLSYDHTFWLMSHYIGMILMILGILWWIKICVDNYLYNTNSSE